MAEMIQTGIYQHYKGAEYEVLGQVKHSETEEDLVIYRALYGEYGLWVRPLTMFQEMVDIDGVSKERFRLIKSQDIQLGAYHRV